MPRIGEDFKYEFKFLPEIGQTKQTDKLWYKVNEVLSWKDASSIDVEYKKREIIDKINSFFGYNYVEKINLNLIPNEKKQIIVNDLKKASKNNFNSSINKINNIGLKNLLNKLIKAYNGKNI